MINSAFEHREISARSFAMNNTQVWLGDDIETIIYNPAGLSNLYFIKCSFTNAKYFDLLDYRTILFSTVLPKNEKFGSIGLGYEEYFFENQYKETKLYFSHGIPITSSLSIGYSLKNFGLYILDPSNKKTMGKSLFLYDISCFYKFFDEISFGCSILNFGDKKIVGDEEIKQIYRVGVGYRPVKNIVTGIDLEILDDKILFNIGVEMNSKETFVLRAGYSSYPEKFTLGIGINVWKVSFDYGVSYIRNLEFQHIFTLSISHSFKKEKIVLEKIYEPVIETRPEKIENVTPEVIEEKVVPEKKVISEELEKIHVKEPEVEKKPVEPTIVTEQSVEEVIIRKININKADINELLELDIPLEVAQDIVRYRKIRGKFRSIDELLKLPSIDKKIFDSIKDRITTK